ncbi:hypothetical protein NW768_010802 [Fusarium equiseti]|uniref:ATP-citrate synthase/succinyl-CoA ligase C-terminal domain-containing protein n=1 Tax=Fusarium equiseti TaxID=61235 RepID=A0ABQ8QZB0_FUSEQ|nr:hypothetical protein NW768_010802 [Fusarium equiseti]
MATRIGSGSFRDRLLPRNCNVLSSKLDLRHQPSIQNQIRSLHLFEHHSQAMLKRADLKIPAATTSLFTRTLQSTVSSYPSSSAFIKRQDPMGSDPVIFVEKGSFTERSEEMLTVKEWFAERNAQFEVLGVNPRASIYLHEAIKITQRWRLTMTIDRRTCTPVIKIRDLQDPVKLPDGTYSGMQYHFELKDGEEKLAPFVANFAGRHELGKVLRESFKKVLYAVYGIFTKCQALSLEVDLLRPMGNKRLICVNSHFEFDDDAPKRARKIYTPSREVHFEVQEERFAEIHGFVYVKMSDGNIGTVVNGAGLAMSTTDAIQQYGGQSNNFLDVGGQATTQTMQKAFRVVMSDPKVKVVIINIYGGITKCDMIAESIIAAAKDYLIGVEVVVRLQGTNAEAGLKMIEDANLGFHVESGFAAAASKAVELSKAVEKEPISPKRLAALDRLGPLDEKELWDNEKLEKLKKRKATKMKQKKVREREITKKAREREEREAEIRKAKLERDAAKAKAKEEANKTW